MEINLKLFASLRKYQLEACHKVAFDSTEPVTVGRLLKAQGVPLAEAPLVLVNGIRTDHGHVLQDGDSVSVFPLIGGG